MRKRYLKFKDSQNIHNKSLLFTFCSLFFALCSILFYSIALEANTKVTKLNYKIADNKLKITIAADDAFRVRVKDYESPPQIVIKIYDAELDIPYNVLPINKGDIEDVSVKEGEEGGKKVTSVTISLRNKIKYDYNISADKKTLTISTPFSGGGESEQGEGKAERLSGRRTISSETGALPPLPSDFSVLPQQPYSKQKNEQKDRVEIPGKKPTKSTSGLITEALNFIDVPLSYVADLLSKSAGVSIVVEQRLSTSTTGTKESVSGTTRTIKGPTEGEGITAYLQAGLTLEEALDVITIANDLAWIKLGEVYLIVSESKAEEGLNPFGITTVRRDAFTDLEIRIYRPKYIDAEYARTYIASIVPDSDSDAEHNILFMEGRTRDIEKAIELLKSIDTPETYNRPKLEETLREYKEVEKEFISKVIKLKYIRADVLRDKLTPLLPSPYLGEIVITGLRTTWPIYDRTTTNDNLLSFDDSTNTLMFVGKRTTYNKLMEIINQLDVPYSATVIKIIPFKYEKVRNFKAVITGSSTTTSQSNVQAIIGRLKSQLIPDESTNTLIFVGTQDDYDRLMQVVNAFDIETKEFISEPVKLSNIRVEDLETSKILDVLNLPEYGYVRMASAVTAGDVTSTRYKINVNTNTVIISGQRQYLEKAIDFIKKLDVEGTDMELRQFKFKYASAPRVFQIIKDLVSNANAGGETLPPTGSFWDFLMLKGAFSSDQDQIGPGSTGFFSQNFLRMFCDTAQNTIMAYGHKQDLKKAEEIIKKLDVPYPQIKIDIQIAEIRNAKQKNLGLGYIYQDKAFTSNFNFSAYPHPDYEVVMPNNTRNGIGHNLIGYDAKGEPIGLFDNAHQVTSGVSDKALGGLPGGGFFLYDTAQDFIISQFAPSLKALITESVGNIIAQPSILAAENTAAEFKFVDTIPYINSTIDVSGKVSTSIDEREYGFAANITPHFTPDGYIVLKLAPLTVSSVKTFTTVANQSIPTIGERTITTEVKLRDGEPLIIGGLYISKEQKTETKVPMLSDVPIFGKLFKKREANVEESEVFIIITPTIVPVS